MIKAPKIMVQAVKNVQPAERRAAALFGERVFFDALDKFRAWADFDEATNMELAAELAAAEIAYRFA